MASKPHAPKTGPGFSAGKAPVKVTNSGDAAKPSNSAGTKRPTYVHPGSGGSSGKAGNHAMLRKPY